MSDNTEPVPTTSQIVESLKVELQLNHLQGLWLERKLERICVSEQETGVAWAIKEVDDMHMNSPEEYDKLFKGIKNSLRDRCKLQAGYDPAPRYPITATLQTLIEETPSE